MQRKAVTALLMLDRIQNPPTCGDPVLGRNLAWLQLSRDQEHPSAITTASPKPQLASLNTARHSLLRSENERRQKRPMIWPLQQNLGNTL